MHSLLLFQQRSSYDPPWVHNFKDRTYLRKGTSYRQERISFVEN